MSYRRYFKIAIPAAIGISGVSSAKGTLVAAGGTRRARTRPPPRAPAAANHFICARSIPAGAPVAEHDLDGRREEHQHTREAADRGQRVRQRRGDTCIGWVSCGKFCTKFGRDAECGGDHRECDRGQREPHERPPARRQRPPCREQLQDQVDRAAPADRRLEDPRDPAPPGRSRDGRLVRRTLTSAMSSGDRCADEREQRDRCARPARRYHSSDADRRARGHERQPDQHRRDDSLAQAFTRRMRAAARSSRSGSATATARLTARAAPEIGHAPADDGAPARRRLDRRIAAEDRQPVADALRAPLP